MEKAKELNGNLEEDSLDKRDSNQKRSNSWTRPMPRGKRRKGDESLYLPPTTSELSSLKETETMFHSCLFRLQVEEMMTELKMKPKTKLKLTKWLASFKTTLTNLEESENYDINDVSWLSAKVKVPIPKQPTIKNGSFSFLPPTQILETGSFVLETLCSPQHVIDLGLEVPKAFWQKADVLNHVYHRKRALYLTYLAQSLMDDPLVSEMQFGFQDDCHLRPVLLIRPNISIGKRCLIRILPFPEKNSFKFSRFIPERNNVRKKWFADEIEGEEMLPTPYYNSTVLQDLLIPELTSFLKEHITSNSVKEGIIMLKVWCIQRKIYGGRSRINGFIISMLVAYLLVKHKINHLMSSYQVFRNALITLKRHWTNEGLTLNEVNSSEFSKYFEVLFIEKLGFLNVCYDVTKESFLRLQHEAELAINTLDTQTESFQNLFMTEIPFGLKFEWIFQVTQFRKYVESIKNEDSFLDHLGDGVGLFIRKIFNELETGLEKRILLVDSPIVSFSTWPITKSPPKLNSQTILFGINQNPEDVFVNLKKGPLADSPEAREFRDYWKEKSELRRFKDGSIHEAVVFSAETLQEKRCVFSEMVKYILIKRLGILDGDFVISGCETDSILQIPTNLTSDMYDGTGEELFTTTMQSFNSLIDDLKRLDEMPLTITSIQGISPTFRFTDVFPSFPKVNESYNEKPLEVIVQLESTGKWPDDLEALQHVKAAFHLKMAELLSERASLSVKPYTSHVDVIKGGFMFRLRIACRKELFLLKQVKVSDGMVKIQNNQDSQRLELVTEILPKVNTVLYGLHQQHNTFGTACRLAKRWVSAQLLQGYIEDIVLEIIMAFVYINPDPYSIPCSPQMAFRRFLNLLCVHNWTSNPLIVNFNNEIESSEIAAIISAVNSQRSSYPPMVIITPFDRTGILWTKECPNLMFLNRICAVSKATLKTLDSQHIEQSSDIKVIFRPPLETYDFIIHLKLEHISDLLYAVDNTANNKQYLREELGFNPVQCYLRDLKETFNDFALFFYDVYGGKCIAGLWKPNAFKTKPFKVTNINGHMISGTNADNTTNIVPNIEALLELFKMYGTGIVKRIDKLTDKWDVE